MKVRLVGSNLPGIRYGDHVGVRVGVQRGALVVDAVPGDAPSAVFDVDVEVIDTGDGVDFRGVRVRGTSGDRLADRRLTLASPGQPGRARWWRGCAAAGGG